MAALSPLLCFCHGRQVETLHTTTLLHGWKRQRERWEGVAIGERGNRRRKKGSKGEREIEREKKESKRERDRERERGDVGV